MIKDILKTMVQALVDEPDLVVIKEIDGRHTSILELTVTQSDIGKVIGKKGRTATALRTILDAVSAKTKKKTVLEIID